MNKYQEALETLKYEIYEEGHCSYIYDEIELAIEVLEKATPKKVTHEATKTNLNTCPNCRNVVGYQDYCMFCGQALDWSEEDVE